MGFRDETVIQGKKTAFHAKKTTVCPKLWKNEISMDIMFFDRRRGGEASFLSKRIRNGVSFYERKWKKQSDLSGSGRILSAAAQAMSGAEGRDACVGYDR